MSIGYFDATLGVNADYRRHRLGSVLLSKVQQNFETRDCEYVYLHCKADNDTALAFYTSQGYRVVRLGGVRAMKSDTSRLDAHRVHKESCWQELGGAEDRGSKHDLQK